MITRHKVQPRPPLKNPRCAARGLSLVELMVGIAVGFFVLIAATFISTLQIQDQRLQTISSQLQQDLRVISELMARDIARAGYWGQATLAVQPDATQETLVLNNPYGSLTYTTSKLEFRRSQDELSSDAVTSENNVLNDNEYAGFAFDSSKGVITMQVSRGVWQPLTDPSTMIITDFTVKVETIPVTLPCGASCPETINTGSALVQCTRNAVITIQAKSAFDNSIKRSSTVDVRLRNDLVTSPVCPP